MLLAPHASRSNEAALCTLKSRWEKRRGGLITRQVSPVDGRLRSSQQYCGSGSWTPSALCVSRQGGGCLSCFKATIGETTTWLGRAPCVPLNGRLRSPSRYCGPIIKSSFHLAIRKFAGRRPSAPLFKLSLPEMAIQIGLLSQSALFTCNRRLRPKY
jgi:hypothetical protein